MSVLYTAPEGCVISHEEYIRKIYRNTHEFERNFNLESDSVVFKIDSPFNTFESPKKKFKSSKGGEAKIQSENIEKIKNKFYELISKAKTEGLFKEEHFSIVTKNVEAKKKADCFYRESSKHLLPHFQGCNNLNHPVIETVNGEKYVFPPMCKFFCKDVAKLKEILDPLNAKFDLIVLDPPWWNKYIRRKKSKCTEASYQMMYNDSLKNLPIAHFSSSNALVAVWCTNSDQNINALLLEVFPKWGLKYVATWIWLKVTNTGEPICAFADLPKKQPYERIIFGSFSNGNREFGVPEDEKLIISVPSAIHSHKPPLSEILYSYLPPKPKCLELFARYLLPNWTSWGNEVIKLQHMSLFEEY